MMKRLRRLAWILILIVDVAYIAWGAGAAASPDHLLGPSGKAILPAGYEGYSGESWSELAGASPLISGYMTVLYRMYGIYCVLFGMMGSAIAVTAGSGPSRRRPRRCVGSDLVKCGHPADAVHSPRLTRLGHRLCIAAFESI
jgi:hypothetical protein